MSRIRPLERSEVDDQVRAIYDEIEAAFGMVPNLFKTYAYFPALLRANWDKTKALMIGGRLPRPLKEMIAVVVSKVNECAYCVAAHGMMLQQLGYTPEQVKALEEGLEEGGQSERERAILALAHKATSTPLRVTDDDVDGLRAVGLSDAEIVEVLGVMELFTGYNKFLDSLAVDIDF